MEFPWRQSIVIHSGKPFCALRQPRYLQRSLTATNGNGSNSITKTSFINVLPKPNVSGSFTPVQICDGDEVTLIGSGAVDYTWKSGLSTLSGNNIEVTIFGNTVYQLIGVDGNGCSDTVNVNVNSSPKPIAGVTSDFSVCSGTSTSLNASGGVNYQWSNGQTGNFIFINPTQTTTYEVYVSFPGSVCVDTASVTVTVLPQKSTQITETVCGNNYFFNGQLLTQSGIYTATFTASNSCDSVVSLNLTLLPTSITNLNAQICSGNTYNFNGQSLTQSGSYAATLNAANGCDSIVNLNLTVASAIVNNLQRNICTGGSYDFNGQTLTQPGVYNATYQSAGGCDSIVRLSLSVNPVPSP